jgi:hypothetical protein
VHIAAGRVESRPFFDARHIFTPQAPDNIIEIDSVNLTGHMKLVYGNVAIGAGGLWYKG